MRLEKIKYYNDVTFEVETFTSQRVEFFLHYWKSLFFSGKVNFDKYYLKSHRTVIDKVDLQIHGNYAHAKKHIKYFFTDDDCFKDTNVIVKEISSIKVKRAILKLKNMSSLSNKDWEGLSIKKIDAELSAIKNWLNNHYSQLLSSSCLSILEKEILIETNEIDIIKSLTNYFIIELYNKGFSTEFIKNLPEYIFNKDKFPYEKIASDFENSIDYDKYKNITWENMTLLGQIKGMISLINRPKVTRHLIFRIYDINWRYMPTKILNVEFYNPNIGFNPKITNVNGTNLFNENFTFFNANTSYEYSSQCNAHVIIEGVNHETLYQIGYNHVKVALSILNKELESNGKVYINNAFITNNNFNSIWGSTDALHKGFRAIDNIEECQLERINYHNKLDPAVDEDIKVLNLLCVISSILVDNENYFPEKLWMILEATFGNENDISILFKAIYRIYLKNNFLFQRKLFFSSMLNPLYGIGHPELEYELLDKIIKKHSINREFSRKEMNLFSRNIGRLEIRNDVLYINEVVKRIEEFNNDKTSFYENVDDFIEFTIKELYIQRNLTVHSNMSDNFFLLKQKEVKSMVNIMLEIFLYEYFKSDTRNIANTTKRLKNNGTKIFNI